MPADSSPSRDAAIKALVLTALAEAGGADYLAEQAAKNPNAFLGLVGKVLAMQAKDEPEGEVVAEIVFRGLNG